MRHIIDTFLEPALWFAADWSLRWAALIAVIALILWIFRPRRAAIRQLYLLAALFAGLLAPFAPRWGEGWRTTHELQESSASPTPSPLPSFPSSAWERTPGSSASRLSMEPDAKQGFASVRYQSELGNEGELPKESLGRRRIVLLILASCWTFVVAYQSIRHLCGWIYLRRLRRESTEATGELAALFAACRAELHVGNAVRLAAHPQVRSPILFGFLRPQIIVPTDWPQRSIESQRAGLLHELAHIRRRDHLLAPLLEIMRVAFFFHPLIRWLLARLEHERELLCDEMVVRLGIDRRDYACLLVEFARRSGRLAWPAASLPMSRRRTVKGRIHHLLEEDMERWIRPLSTRWAVILGAGFLAVSLGLTSYRVWAEDKVKKEADKKAEQQPAPNKSAAPIRREDLRYGEKDFNRWRRELLTELKPSIRADGMKAFAAFGANGYGSEATQAILEIMRSYDPAIERSAEEEAPVVQAGFHAIFKIGAAAVPALTDAVKEENRNARRFAIEALRRMGSYDKPALSALLQACKNTDPDVRSSAITAIGQNGQGTKEIVTVLIDALNDNNGEVRAAAANALSQKRESGKPAIPALLNALEDKDTWVRAAAIHALAVLGAGAKAVPAVGRLLQDKEKFVGDRAFEYLRNLQADQTREAIPIFIAALKKSESQDYAILLLARIGPAAKDALPELTKLIQSDNPKIRNRAMEAIKKIDSTNKD